MTVPAILVTGTVGAGKTAVAGAMGVLMRDVCPHAVIDLDALSESWPRPPGDPFNSAVTFRNLACVWENFREQGAERLILPRVIESLDEVARYEAAVPGIELQICRLAAPEELRLARLTAREAALGSRAWHLARTVELAAKMDRDRLEDFLVDNGDRPVEDVASDVLTRAGWLRPATPPGPEIRL